MDRIDIVYYVMLCFVHPVSSIVSYHIQSNLMDSGNVQQHTFLQTQNAYLVYSHVVTYVIFNFYIVSNVDITIKLRKYF